ncbi:uncharacterized protein LOC105861111 [Microcebus murinus]|uniref:uncharacterized protein LOC105861111 n=1 Tax=Microcebus murinus TaxID=30608 RepID=UPI003F6B08C4
MKAPLIAAPGSRRRRRVRPLPPHRVPSPGSARWGAGNSEAHRPVPKPDGIPAVRAARGLARAHRGRGPVVRPGGSQRAWGPSAAPANQPGPGPELQPRHEAQQDGPVSALEGLTVSGEDAEQQQWQQQYHIPGVSVVFQQDRGSRCSDHWTPANCCHYRWMRGRPPTLGKGTDFTESLDSNANLILKHVPRPERTFHPDTPRPAQVDA